MKILLVDDEEDIRKIGRMSLVRVGNHDVVLADSAAEALAVARAERPDLILMDVMMPGVDGLTGLAAIRDVPELREIPAIFMTARVQRAEIEQCLAAGAVGVIHKPFDPMTLPAEILRLLGKASPP